MNPDRYQQHMKRLERKRELLNQRLEKQRERINTRFDCIEAKLSGELNARQEQIVATALEILKVDGLAGVSLREIAKRMRVQAPALYWHFKSKEALVDYMAEAILRQAFPELTPRQARQNWQEWLLDQMIRLRQAMLAYPDGGRVVAGAHFYPAITLAALMECCLESLVTSGLSTTDARHIVTTCVHYTFGRVIEEQSSPTAEELAAFRDDPIADSYPQLQKIACDIENLGGAADNDFMIDLRSIMRGGTHDATLFQYCQKLVILSADKQQVLLAKRKGEADYDGTYSFVGGKMEITDESIIAGMKREKDEEIGTEATVKILPHETHNLLFRKKDGNSMILPHIAGIYAGGGIQLNEEYSDYAWVPLAELADFGPKIPGITEITAWAVRQLQSASENEFVAI